MRTRGGATRTMQAHVGAYVAHEPVGLSVWAHGYSEPNVEDMGGVLGPLGRHKGHKRAPVIYPIFLPLFFRVGLSFFLDVHATWQSVVRRIK